MSFRHRTFQSFQSAGPRRAIARYTTLVLIDDDVYWKKPSSGRVPIHRDVLASIVTAVASHNPAIIALDVDFSTGDETTTTTLNNTPYGKVTFHEHEQFAEETLQLFTALRQASEKSAMVVLSEDIGRDRDDKNWMRLADVYDGLDMSGIDLRTGYIQLDTDTRKLPPPLLMTARTDVNSFSIAVAAAYRPDEFRGTAWDSELFAGFIEAEKFPQIAASTLLEPDSANTRADLKELMAHKIVLIGGMWHKS